MPAAVMDEFGGEADVVRLRPGATPAKPTEVCISCPDVVGLGSDLARILFDFGLVVTRGDFSTDGKWCFVVFEVFTGEGAPPCKWRLLKSRLEHVCPSPQPRTLTDELESPRPPPSSPKMYMFQVCASDRCGVLHDVTQTLWQEQMSIHQVHVSTSPDNNAVDLFFVTDDKNELPSEVRAADVCEAVCDTLRDCVTNCSMWPAPCHSPPFKWSSQEVREDEPADLLQDCDDLFQRQTHLTEWTHHDENQPSSTVVSVDNTTSKNHTLLYVRARDRKGLLYDLLRVMKDVSMQVSYGKIKSTDSFCEMDLLVRQADGSTLPDKLQDEVKRQLRIAIESPIRIACGNKGTDAACTELLVVTPVDKGGGVRPRVLIDVTAALRELAVSVFKADIHHIWSEGRHEEVHRFLLTNSRGQPIASIKDRMRICKRVRAYLMG
eukprot:jgi/Chlat1/5997/Chrsp4S06312